MHRTLTNSFAEHADVAIAARLASRKDHTWVRMVGAVSEVGDQSPLLVICGVVLTYGVDREDRIDPPHCLQREWGNGGQLTARLGSHVGQHKKLASGMRPACRFLERTSSALGRVKTIEPGKRVRLQDAAEPGEVLIRVLA